MSVGGTGIVPGAVRWTGLLRHRIGRQFVRLVRLKNLRGGPCGNLRCNHSTGIRSGGYACTFIGPETELELTVAASDDSKENHAGNDSANREEKNARPFTDTYRAWRFWRQIEATGRDDI